MTCPGAVEPLSEKMSVDSVPSTLSKTVAEPPTYSTTERSTNTSEVKSTERDVASHMGGTHTVLRRDT